MDTQNDGLEKVTPLENIACFLVSMLNFCGVFPMPHSGSTSHTSPSTQNATALDVRSVWESESCLKQRLTSTRKETHTVKLTSCRLSTYVDGEEKSGDSPVDMENRSHYLQGFIVISGGCFGFLPSTVWTPMRATTKSTLHATVLHR